MFRQIISVACFLLLRLPAVVAQPVPSASDSLPLRILSPVVVEAFAIEGDQLQRFYRTTQSATTEDILCHMPSVYLIRRGSYGQEPVIRGLSAGQLAVMVDGMRMFGACTDKMDPVSIYIEPQNLKSLNVSPGVSGSSYGSTVGGSINMSLARPDFNLGQEIQTGATYFTASRGIAAYGIANFATTKQAVRASAVYRNHQPYRSGGGERIAYTQYEKINTLVSSSWLIGSDTLTADALLDYGWNIGFPALPMDVGYASAGIGSVTYSHSRPDRLIPFLTAKAYYNRIYHSMDDSKRPDVVMRMDMPGWSTTLGAYAEGSLRSPAKHRLSFRADAYFNKVLAEMTMYPENENPMYMQTWPDSWRGVTGLFVKDGFSISNQSEVILQARVDVAYTHLREGFGLDQLRVFYPDIKTGRMQMPFTADIAYATYVNARMRLTLQGGYGQRIASLSEHAGFYLFNRADGHDYVGNPYLKNEKSFQGSTSIDFLGNQSEVEMRVFAKRFTDYILGQTDPSLSAMTPGAYGVRIYQNYPNAFFTGVEAKWIWHATEDLMMLTQLKYVRARLNTGEAVPLIPPLNALLSVRRQGRFINIQLDAEANAAQPMFNEAFGEDRTPAFAIINLRLDRSWQLGKINVLTQAGAENLFDKRYHMHLDWGNIPRPGRNIYVTVQLTRR